MGGALERTRIVRRHRGTHLRQQGGILFEEQLGDLPEQFLVASKPIQRYRAIQAGNLRCELHTRLLRTRTTLNWPRKTMRP
jgi:hypothetical protein